MNAGIRPPSSRGVRHAVAGLLNGVLLLGAAAVAGATRQAVAGRTL